MTQLPLFPTYAASIQADVRAIRAMAASVLTILVASGVLAQSASANWLRVSRTPSKTEPYYVCPPSSGQSRRLRCQAIEDPVRGVHKRGPVPAGGITRGPVQEVSPALEGSGVEGGYSPENIRSAYDLPSTSAGSGQTVAVVDAYDDSNAESDLGVYRKEYGLGECASGNGCFRKVNQTGGTSYPAPERGWAKEISLDLDMVSAVCPKCHILLVEASTASSANLAVAEDEAAALGATEISNSFGAKELSEPPEYAKAYDHPGIPVAVAGGDEGYGVSSPASNPNAIAVGGTTLHKASNARGWEETVWYHLNEEGVYTGTGSGCSKEAKPDWQTDTGCSYRTTNDVAADADPNTPVSVYDSYETEGRDWRLPGGTSVATPIVAATMALGSSYARSLPGADAFYQEESQGVRLTDITSGDNSIGGCSPSYLCTAGTGYDGPTGVGSPWAAPVPTAPQPSPSSDWSAREPSGGRQWEYYRGVNGAVLQLAWTGSSWASPVELGGQMASGTTTALVREPKSGDQWVFYTTSGGGIDYWEWNGSEWHDESVTGSKAAAGSSPSALENGLDGLTVYYRGGEGALWQSRLMGSGWVDTKLGGEVEAGTSPAAIGDTGSGQQWVYYVSSSAELNYWEWTGSAWREAHVQGSSTTGGSSPSVVREPYSSEQWVYYRGSNGAVWQAKWSGSSWSDTDLGGSVAAGASPDVVRLSGQPFTQWVSYLSTSGSELYYWELSGSEWHDKSVPGSSASGATPAAIAEEGSLWVDYAGANSGIWQAHLTGTEWTNKEVWRFTPEFTVQSTADPSGATSTGLTDVSCGVPGACTGVGGSTNSSGVLASVAERWNGAEWSLQSTPNPSGASESLLRGISCTTSAACSASGYYKNSSGAYGAFAEQWNGTAWSLQSIPNPSGASESWLARISCTSSSACTAVGHYKNSSGVLVALAERWNGTEWLVQSTPNPSGAQASELYGVSCASSTACTAVGRYKSSSGVYENLAEQWSGTEWVLESAPNPSGGQTPAELIGVSCTAASACTAVGYYENGSDVNVTLAERWNGTAWAVQGTPNYTGAKQSELWGVSCISSTACTAVGYYIDSAGAWLPLAESWGGAEWSTQLAAKPSAAKEESPLWSVSCNSPSACVTVGEYKTGFLLGESKPLRDSFAESYPPEFAAQSPLNPSGAKESRLTGLSCSSASTCTGVGMSANGSGVVTPLSERWKAEAWSLQSVPTPTGASESQFRGVSCPSSTACAAVGSYINSAGTRVTLAESWKSGEWLVKSTPNPSGAKESSLESVSCTSGSACTATGSYLNSTGTRMTLAEHWNGTEWTIQSTPNPSGAAASSLRGIECTSSTWCEAVGYTSANIGGGDQTNLVEVFSGGEWSLKAAPNPSGARAGELLGVSCKTSSSCTAVGYYQNSAGTDMTLAESWNGSELTIQYTPNPSGAQSDVLHSVSCATTTTCVATGTTQTGAGVNQPLAETWNGTEWTTEQTATPSGAKESTLNSISCNSTTACVTAGSYTNSSGVPVTLVEGEL